MSTDPLVAALARLQPAGTLNREQLFWQAGRAAARPNRGWIIAAVALLATNLLTAGLWFARPTPIVVVPLPPPVPEAVAPDVASPPSDESNYLAWRERLLRDSLASAVVNDETYVPEMPLTASQQSLAQVEAP